MPLSVINGPVIEAGGSPASAIGTGDAGGGREGPAGGGRKRWETDRARGGRGHKEEDPTRKPLARVWRRKMIPEDASGKKIGGPCPRRNMPMPEINARRGEAREGAVDVVRHDAVAQREIQRRLDHAGDRIGAGDDEHAGDDGAHHAHRGRLLVEPLELRAPGLGGVDERRAVGLFEVAERRHRDGEIDRELPQQRQAPRQVRALDAADGVALRAPAGAGAEHHHRGDDERGDDHEQTHLQALAILPHHPDHGNPFWCFALRRARRRPRAPRGAPG